MTVHNNDPENCIDFANIVADSQVETRLTYFIQLPHKLELQNGMEDQNPTCSFI